jgi:hypothetical protein
VKHIALLAFLLTTGLQALLAQPSAFFGGTILYSVEPLDVPDSRSAHVPTEVELSTNGTDFRVVERGSDFERVWVQQAGEARVHFHFLGHAISLAVPCEPPTAQELVTDELLGSGPCFWPGSFMPITWVHSEDGMTYRLQLERVTPVDALPEGTFEHPTDHVLMARETLSTLVSSVDSPRKN